MEILTSSLQDYELLDSGNEKRLERFGKYILSRPDPQALWKPHLSLSQWQHTDAVFDTDTTGKERWIKKPKEEAWKLSYKHISFLVKLSPFKHTGVFPEQVAHWLWIEEILSNNSNSKILNLFSYTGIASLVAASIGAHVTNVDSSRPTIGWAKENQALSKLQDKPIRYILDDALQFCKREKRRGNTYEGIIVDPPVFGHGPNGEVWKFHEHFPELLEICMQLLSPKKQFIVINAYAVSVSALMLHNMLKDYTQNTIQYGELAIPEENTTRLLSTGIFARIKF